MRMPFIQFSQTARALIWKYDTELASTVAHLPPSIRPLSVIIGKATLPIYWAVILAGTSTIIFSLNAKLGLVGFATLMCLPLATILKLVVRRSRPNTPYVRQMKIQSYSFPSSHAYSATIAGGYLAVLSLTLLPDITGYLLTCGLLLLAATVGISRVHIGAHYPTDVSAGWLLGTIMLITTTQLVL